MENIENFFRSLFGETEDYRDLLSAYPDFYPQSYYQETSQWIQNLDEGFSVIKNTSIPTKEIKQLFEALQPENDQENFRALFKESLKSMANPDLKPKYQQDNEVYEYFSTNRVPGSPFPSIPVKVPSTNEFKTLHFEENDLKVYLILIGISHVSLEYVQDLFESNPNWRENVKILSLSKSNSGIFIEENMESPNISYYSIDDQQFSSISREYFSSPSDFCCVRQGKVLWVHHKDLDIWRSDVDSLIQGIDFKPKVWTPEEGLVRQNFSEEVHNEMMRRGHEKMNQFIFNHPHLRPPNISSILTFRMELGSEIFSNYEFKFEGEYELKDREVIEGFLKEISEIFPNPVNEIRYVYNNEGVVE